MKYWLPFILLAIGLLVGYFFFHLPLIPLVLAGILAGCLIAFAMFAFTEKETEEKIEQLVKEEEDHE